jgi:ribonuclease BN (tRNA processing enzyme)
LTPAKPAEHGKPHDRYPKIDVCRPIPVIPAAVRRPGPAIGYNTVLVMKVAQPLQPALFADAVPPTSPRRRVTRASGTLARAALRLCVLGSGSGGNSTVLAHGDDALLIDAGFGPGTTRRRLAQARVDADRLRAICLTHLDRDHFRPAWITAALRAGIRLCLHHWHLPELHAIRGAQALFDAGLIDTFDTEAFEPMPGLTASPVRLQHDLQGTIGYRFDARRAGARGSRFVGSVAYATDLGHVPPALLRLFAGVDLLCLECNYDEHMTIHSPRPAFVNRRNLSDSGHLSNEQSFEAIRQIAAASPGGNPRHVLLMHRSQQCNHPTKVRRVFERDPQLSRRVVLTEQRRRTRWFAAKPLPAVQRAQAFLY